ncbi:MAG: hypothetical protein MRECE_15c020 [Mycoplasmataceae bacterium CE_OT135]|nr:MAG: hypothetical protein MRECE_15c020 [Mycoplasmataceae bacterium CE_OT135]
MTKISIKIKIKEVGKFSDNIYAIIPAEPINLEAERMGIINVITIPYDGELCVGDTITIQDIDLNDLPNVRRISENNGIRSWDIRGNFGEIVINERSLGIENLDQAIRQNNENPQQPFFIFKGTDLQDGEISWVWTYRNIEHIQPGGQIGGMTIKKIEVNENGHPSEHYVAFWTVDGYCGCVGKVPANIGHQTATYHLKSSVKIDGEDMKAIVFPGRQNFCSGTELPFAPDNKGLNSLIGNETYLNKENLYIIVSREDFYDSLILAGNFKVTNADGIHRFLANGASQFNYQNLPTVSSIRNTRNNGGEGLNRGQNWGPRNLPNNQGGGWVIDQSSVVKHNQLVERYNRVNGAAISEVNRRFTSLWDQLSSQRENLPANKLMQRLLAKIEGQSQQKFGQDEEITAFAELQELVLLDPNAEVEKIIEQANQNFRQMEINQSLYEKKCQLIWWISKLLNQEKPAVLEQKPTDDTAADGEELSPPELENEIEEQLESDNDEEKIENDKGIEKTSPEQAPMNNASAKEITAKKKDDALFTTQKLVRRKIKQLLEKNSLTNQGLPPEYQNWWEQIQKLDSNQAINQFLQQMEAAINKKTQTLNQTVPHSPVGKNDYPLLWLGLGAIVFCAGGLIVLFASSWQKRKN